MWSFERIRHGVAASLIAASLTGCGFTPAYGPSGGAQVLDGQIRVDAPDNRYGYLLRRRIEERIGRAEGPYVLTVNVSTEEQDFGTTSAGFTTRFRIVGSATYSLEDSRGIEIAEGEAEEFVGYSATGSIVSTPASQSDAEERLATILGDRIVEDLLFVADRLTPAR
jgi:LPS-assembly lipoprotein